MPGPSPHTKGELEALTTFTHHNTASVPHLIGSVCLLRPDNGTAVFPGGYISITIMTRMPGVTLWDLRFWSLAEEEREEIRRAFLVSLR